MSNWPHLTATANKSHITTGLASYTLVNALTWPNRAGTIALLYFATLHNSSDGGFLNLSALP